MNTSNPTDGFEEEEKESPGEQSVGKGVVGCFRAGSGATGARPGGRVGRGGAAPSNERRKQMRPWPDRIRRVGAARGHDGLRAKPIATALSDWRHASVCCGRPRCHAFLLHVILVMHSWTITVAG